MNNTLNEHLNQLRILSRLEEGQSLDTSGSLNIYKPCLANWLMRKWNKDNKDAVIKFLQPFYQSIDQIAEQLIANYRKEKDENIRTKIIYQLQSLAEKIFISIKGIENLYKTYRDYPQIMARLEGIVQDIALLTYKQLLDNIPKDRHKGHIKSNLTFMGIIIHVVEGDKSLIESQDKKPEIKKLINEIEEIDNMDNF